MNENQENIKSFWSKGNGKEFLDWSKISITDLNKDFNNQLFLNFDEDLDQLVSAWIKDGNFSDIMRFLHGSKNYKSLPQTFTEWHEKSAVIPDWLQLDVVETGAQFCQRSGLMGLLVLRNFALLGGYYFSNLTKPLVATGMLEKGATYRLHNTLQFWIEVSRSGQAAQSLRINSCLKIRLIHSASRIMIKEKNVNWDYATFGEPINHADMVATNIAFTVYYLFGLQRLNVSYSIEEERGIFHLWKYVTWLLGIPQEILPNNRQEALSFFYHWTLKQDGPDKDSIKLAKSLLEEDTPIALMKVGVLKRNMGFIHRSIANELIDDQIVNSLQIPVLKFNKIIPIILRFKNEIEKNVNTEKQIIKGNTEQRSVLNDYKNNMVKPK